MSPDDEPAKRTADDGAGDQTKGGCSDGGFHGIALAELYGDGSKGCGVAVAPGHGNGTGHHGQQRRNLQYRAQAQGDTVLKSGQDGSRNAEQHHVFAAGFQQAQAGCRTAGGKEDAVEQAVGYLVVKLQFADARVVKQ